MESGCVSPLDFRLPDSSPTFRMQSNFGNDGFLNPIRANDYHVPASSSTAGKSRVLEAATNEDMVAVEFTFDVPAHCQSGSQLQVPAPDGQKLLLRLPRNAQGADKVVMSLSDEGLWTISHISRPDAVPPPLPSQSPSNQWLSKEQIEHDLANCGHRVKLQTTKGCLEMRIVPKWSPKGAERLLQLMHHGFFQGRMAIYRAVPDFLVQFGVVMGGLNVQPIEDDPLVGVPVEAGSIVFAAAGANARRHTLCIFLKDYPQLGRKASEAPIGKVDKSSMDVLRSIYTGYGDIPQAGGQGPDPLLLEERGNDYIYEQFPLCDFVIGSSTEGEEEDDSVCTIA